MCPVAVKRIHSVDNFDEEIRWETKFRHPNLVSLVGYTDQLLLYELLTCSLFDRLHNNGSLM